MPKTINLSGVVGWDITAKGLKEAMPSGNAAVMIKVDSVGGSVFEGNRIYNLLMDRERKYPGKTKVELGVLAASAASYFPMGVGKDNITVRENTVFMAHKAWSLAIGNADDLKEEAEILDGFDQMIAKVYSKVTGEEIENILAYMKNEMWLMGGQAVVDAGFASAISDAPEEGEEVESEEDGEEPEMKTKAEVRAMIKEAQALLKAESQEEDLAQWAAMLTAPEAAADGQYEMFENASHSGDKIMEVDMKLSEYLDQNPEAKAEHEAMINAKAEEAAKDAVEKDRGRSSEILALAGVGVSDEILNAVKDGTTSGDFAKAEISRRQEERAEVVESDDGGLEVKGQTPAAPKNSSEKKDEAIEASVKDYLDQRKKRR